MNWISEDHKNLYSKAASAFYSDLKKGTGILINNGEKAASVGYEKVIEGINYFKDPDKTKKDNKIDNPYYIDSIEDIIEDEFEDSIDNTENTDDSDYINQLGKINPKVLIILGKNNEIKKIYIINGEKLTQIRGKIASYDYINTIIFQWFRYEKNCKWYPKTKLYTSYRQNGSKLEHMDKIVFINDNGYYPHPYHPLI